MEGSADGDGLFPMIIVACLKYMKYEKRLLYRQDFSGITLQVDRLRRNRSIWG